MDISKAKNPMTLKGIQLFMNFQQLCIIFFYSLISSFWNLSNDKNLNEGNLFPFRRCKVTILFVLHKLHIFISWWEIVHFSLVSKLRLGLDSKTGKLIEIRQCEHHFLRPPKKIMNGKKCQNAKHFLRFSLSWFSIYNIWMRCLVF